MEKNPENNPANWEDGQYVGPTVQCTECENHLSPNHFEAHVKAYPRCIGCENAEEEAIAQQDAQEWNGYHGLSEGPNE